MDANDLKKRIARLEMLSLSLAREALHWQTCDAPVLYVERRDYRAAIRDAQSGMEAARVILVKIRQRLEGRAAKPDTSD